MNSKEIKKIRSNGEIKKVLNRGEVLWQGGLDLMSLPIGTRIVDRETKYYGQPIVWLIADKNHSGYPSDSVTLISEKILCLKAFDAREPKNPEYSPRSSGNNIYKFSNILQWLNSDKTDWYSPQHPYDAPPIREYLREGYANPYKNEPGFLYNFSTDFKNSLMTTACETYHMKVNKERVEFVKSKIFLASMTEVGFGGKAYRKEGNLLKLFENSNYLKTNFIVGAVDLSDCYVDYNNNTGNWLLRGNSVTERKDDNYVTDICAQDPEAIYDACLAYTSVRPLCNVRADSSFFELFGGKYTKIKTWKKYKTKFNWRVQRERKEEDQYFYGAGGIVIKPDGKDTFIYDGNTFNKKSKEDYIIILRQYNQWCLIYELNKYNFQRLDYNLNATETRVNYFTTWYKAEINIPETLKNYVETVRAEENTYPTHGPMGNFNEDYYVLKEGE